MKSWWLGLLLGAPALAQGPVSPEPGFQGPRFLPFQEARAVRLVYGQGAGPEQLDDLLARSPSHTLEPLWTEVPSRLLLGYASPHGRGGALLERGPQGFRVTRLPEGQGESLGEERELEFPDGLRLLLKPAAWNPELLIYEWQVAEP